MGFNDEFDNLMDFTHGVKGIWCIEVLLLSSLMVRLSSTWPGGASSSWLQCPFYTSLVVLVGTLLSGVGILSSLTSCPTPGTASFQEALLSFSGKWCWDYDLGVGDAYYSVGHCFWPLQWTELDKNTLLRLVVQNLHYRIFLPHQKSCFSRISYNYFYLVLHSRKCE